MDAQNRHIDRLIARHLDGESLSDAEQAELLDWLRSSEEHRHSYLEAYDAWGERHLSDTRFDAEAAYRRLTERIAGPEGRPAAPAVRRRRAVRRRLVGTACAAVCAALLVTGFFLRGKAERQIPDIREFVQTAEAPVYTGKEARLVLSERKTVRIEEKRSSIRYDAAEIHINEDAREPIEKKEVAAFNQLLVPYGKQTTLTLADGTQTTVQIVGFAHDDKTSGGKAGITFIFGDCVGQEPMNEEGTNEGGWEASPMRTYLNGTWRAQLPEDLDAVIVPVDKLTNNEGETKSAASVTSTSDSLWLPSVVELVGPIGDVYFGEEDRYRPVGDILNAEGSVYKLYRDAGVDTSGDNAILVKSGEGVSSYDGPSAPWWERSAYSPFYRKNFAVDTLGNALYATESDGTCCFAPGFCI